MNWGYISAFWTTVVMNCVQPVNIEACLKINEWLIPAAHDYIDFRSQEPYASEKQKLKEFRLDGGRTEP